MMGKLAFAVAIPARNEAERIGACLDAIARQRGVALADGAVVVLANNCTDETAKAAREREVGCRVHVVEHTFALGEGAGGARRLAMARARALVRRDGILLTNDADAIADDDWIAAMLRCFGDARVDAVAGRVSGNWEEMRHHPAAALEAGALECRYSELTACAEATLDPLPHDPPPRHAQQCGANIGIRAAMFDAVGGVPAIPVGEDRALLQAVAMRDGGIRHANAPHVTASARLDGRAEGGMATALRERISGTYRCDELLLPAAVLEARMTLRREARAAFVSGQFAGWAARHGAENLLAEPYFGSSWAAFQALRPDLAATPLRPADLPDEIRKLEQLLCREEARDVA